MNEVRVDERIDLSGVICPNNFVKTKLKLEEMQAGQILEVILDEGEPIKNVPRAVKEEGHQILKVEKIGKYWRLLIRKHEAIT
ncbi:MAG: sulfurtransferase TusA family protein [Desulfobacteraceae bacterium]|uniref:Sulfurtransferase TusA family protein n=1 Tax=Aerophobetes bacterium TaxID=2030807 RepID=A0A523RVJ0_UNCAE|nr:MAG: sulfurtransferase TusA family protein [Candidatus Aerophobetes bacterium]TET94005.1 MAG: sulfurtransferase TusA family protein [Desulfobacteraceae bacterium]